METIKSTRFIWVNVAFVNNGCLKIYIYILILICSISIPELFPLGASFHTHYS